MIRVDLSSIAPTAKLLGHQQRLAEADDAEGPATVGACGRSGCRSLADQLKIVQHAKCAYCENWLDERSDDIEHIRPRAKAKYWWLAFSVPNLILACHSCNSFKGTKFDLQPDVMMLTARATPWHDPDPEPAMLVDPSREDPGHHLTFLFEHGGWRIAPLTDRGRWTIETLALDRAGLTKRITAHVVQVVDPALVRLATAEAAADLDAARGAIVELVDLARPGAPFAQLVRCIITEFRAGRYPPAA